MTRGINIFRVLFFGIIFIGIGLSTLSVQAQLDPTCLLQGGICYTGSACLPGMEEIVPKPWDCVPAELCCRVKPDYKPAGWSQQGITCAELAAQSPPVKCSSGLLCEDTKTWVFGETTYWGGGAGSYTEVSVAKCVDTSLYNQTTDQAVGRVEFVPQVTIPGSITIGGQEITFIKGKGIEITSSTAAQYFAVFYRFFMAALAVMAVVMVMWGGFKRIMAAGSPDKVKDANGTIAGALTGLLIALLSYSLLSLMNPDLVALRPLTAITTIDRIDFSVEGKENEESLTSPGPPRGNIVVIGGTNIVNTGGYQANEGIVSDLRAVALKLKEQGFSMVVSSADRTSQRQKELILENCQNPPGSATCNPKPGKPATCIMKDLDPRNCPHTTGRAVDVWGGLGNTASITRDKCLENIGDCRNNIAMAALGKAMIEQDFCNLASEPWHFEKPKMSTSCSDTY